MYSSCRFGANLSRWQKLAAGRAPPNKAAKLFRESRIARDFLHGSWLRFHCRKLPVSRHPPTSKKWQPATTHRLCTAGYSLPAFHFWLFPQTVCALLETTNGFDSYPSLQGESVLCKIAHEFKDDLNDDSVRNSCQSIERSRVSAMPDCDDLAKKMARQSAAYVQTITEQAR